MPQPLPKEDVPDDMFGRVHTLKQTGSALYMLGLSARPLAPMKVLRIERRALAKVRRALKGAFA
jgi:hypothetical protein